jgi:hypothetical protein
MSELKGYCDPPLSCPAVVSNAPPSCRFLWRSPPSRWPFRLSWSPSLRARGSWLILHCRPNVEFRVAAHPESIGAEYFLPLIRGLTGPRRKRQPVAVSWPWANYIFIGRPQRRAGKEAAIGFVAAAVVSGDGDLLVGDEIRGFFALSELRAGLGPLLVGAR